MPKLLQKLLESILASSLRNITNRMVGWGAHLFSGAWKSIHALSGLSLALLCEPKKGSDCHQIGACLRHCTTTHASRVLRRGSQQAFAEGSHKGSEKVPRDGFERERGFSVEGSEKVASRRYSEGRNTPLCRVRPLGRAPYI